MNAMVIPNTSESVDEVKQSTFFITIKPYIMKNFNVTSFFISLIITSLTLTLISCGDDNDAGGGATLGIKAISGNIEKGPFVQGAKVTLYELNADLSQTGKLFRTQTTSDLGAFAFDSQLLLSSQYVEIEASGYFYNEVKGKLSNSQISLYALSNVLNRNLVNVNIITHLEYGRVKKLLLNGMDFNAAKKQAEKELLACFAITEEISTPEAISVTDNNNNSAILLAISTIMLYNRSEAEFTQFISKFSTDFADNGEIDDTTIRDEVKQGQEHAQPSEVVENMKEYYSKNGINIQCDNFARYIDFNGDGMIDDKDAEPDNNNYIAEETFWDTKEKALLALNTCYTTLREFVVKQLRIEYLYTKKYSDGAPWYDTSLDKVVIRSDNNLIREAYENAYKAVSYVNMMIDNKDKICKLFEDETIIGQLYLMRAFLYYNIGKFWGRVPSEIYNSTEKGDDTRAYTFRYALDDIKKAESLLDGTIASSKYQFTIDAAYMLSAEISLSLHYESSLVQSYLSCVDISKYNVSIDNSTDVYNGKNMTPIIFAIAMENGYCVPIYTNAHYYLLEKEAKGIHAYSEWENLPCTEYGYWEALERIKPTRPWSYVIEERDYD